MSLHCLFRDFFSEAQVSFQIYRLPVPLCRQGDNELNGLTQKVNSYHNKKDIMFYYFTRKFRYAYARVPERSDQDHQNICISPLRTECRGLAFQVCFRGLWFWKFAHVNMQMLLDIMSRWRVSNRTLTKWVNSSLMNGLKHHIFCWITHLSLFSF